MIFKKIFTNFFNLQKVIIIIIIIIIIIVNDQS